MPKPVRSSRRNKVLVPSLMVVFLALMSITGLISNSSAHWRQEHDIFYYTDDTYTVQCGYKIYPCYGTVRQSGCVTPYIYDEWYDC